MVVVPKSSKCLRASEVSLLRQFLAKDLRDDLFYQVFEQWSGLRATTKASLARLVYRVYINKRYYLDTEKTADSNSNSNCSRISEIGQWRQLPTENSEFDSKMSSC